MNPQRKAAEADLWTDTRRGAHREHQAAQMAGHLHASSLRPHHCKSVEGEVMERMPLNDARQLPPEAAEFLQYWFEELAPEQWWTRDATVDEALRSRFGSLCERLAHEIPHDWLLTPRGTLAAVMVLDQLPRNLYRDDPRAYATDAKALACARHAVDRHMDRALSNDERMFLYLPFQHSEDPADQARSVELYRALGDAKAADFAVKHRDIIHRFGRFPHRNRVLGRESTPEEVEFLKGPALFW